LVPVSQIKWQNNLQLGQIKLSGLIYMKTHLKVTTDTKLQWFQFRINHRILTTNTFLVKIHITDNPLCTSCRAEQESLEHLFWFCNKTQSLLNDPKQLLDSRNVTLNLERNCFILGKGNETRQHSVENYILLNINLYIYIYREFLKRNCTYSFV